MSDTSGKPRSRVIVTAAILVLGLWAWLTWYMVQNVGLADPQWSRLSFVFAGVEAVVFSAAGWLFGTEIQRRQTEQAASEADSQRSRADARETDSDVLKALLAAIEGSYVSPNAEGVPRGGELSRSRAAGEAGVPPSQAQLDPAQLLAVAEAARQRSLNSRQ